MLLISHNQSEANPEGIPNAYGSQNPDADFKAVARSLLKARKVAVVCGAGISCAAGIPDFRSSEGLFRTLKERNPQARLSSGKDLFDASLFQTEANTSLFYTMIAELCEMSAKAEPTAFHRLLKWLDDQGKLFRVYTQNIDCLEQKAGLTFGLGDREPLPHRSRSPHPRKKRKLDNDGTQSALNVVASNADEQKAQAVLALPASTPKSKKSDKAAQVPRVIPLHGSLHTLQCTKCHQLQDLLGNQSHQAILKMGKAVACAACLESEEIRSISNERKRGVGMMKPNVVLYGEAHADADTIGRITEKDLMGSRPDLLLVCGTSLKVHGTKRLVRELAKVTNPGTNSVSTVQLPGVGASGASQARTIFLNLDFPTQAKEWAGLFDVWVKADAQTFADQVMAESLARQDKLALSEERRLKSVEKKRSFSAAAVTKASGSAQTKPVLQKAIKPPPLPAKKPGYEMVLMDERNVFLDTPIVQGQRNRRPPAAYSSQDFVGPTSRVLHVRSVEPPTIEAAMTLTHMPLSDASTASSVSDAAVSLVSTPSGQSVDESIEVGLPPKDENLGPDNQEAGDNTLSSAQPFEVRISPINKDKMHAYGLAPPAFNQKILSQFFGVSKVASAPAASVKFKA